VKHVTLTARQLEIARLLARGLNYAEVAAELDISRRTVEHHVAELRRRTGSRTTVAAVSHARRRAPSAHAQPTRGFPVGDLPN
jgi:DNA-binding CsgD family transcriptional regulator